MITSLGLVYVSRASLKLPRSHGFYRLIAWEVILIGVLFNLTGWFTDPWSWNQVVSWILLILSLYLFAASVVRLKRSGKPDPQRRDTALIGFEKTTQLVTDGIYGWIRHPMYSSLLFLAWGVFFKSPSWLDGLIVVIASLALTATAVSEEAEDVRFFGLGYQEYMARTKRFIPFIF